MARNTGRNDQPRNTIQGMPRNTGTNDQLRNTTPRI